MSSMSECDILAGTVGGGPAVGGSDNQVFSLDGGELADGRRGRVGVDGAAVGVAMLHDAAGGLGGRCGEGKTTTPGMRLVRRWLEEDVCRGRGISSYQAILNGGVVLEEAVSSC